MSAKLPDQIRALSRRGSSNSLSKAGEVSSLEAPGISSKHIETSPSLWSYVCWLPLRHIYRIQFESIFTVLSNYPYFVIFLIIANRC